MMVKVGYDALLFVLQDSRDERNVTAEVWGFFFSIAGEVSETPSSINQAGTLLAQISSLQREMVC